MNIDHIFIWVDNQQRSLAFFVDLLGMEPVRSDEFAEGKTSFPSVRLNESTLIDLMDRSAAPKVREFTGGEAGGAPINHVCLSVAASEYAAIVSRLAERGVELKFACNPTLSFGSRYQRRAMNVLGIAALREKGRRDRRTLSFPSRFGGRRRRNGRIHRLRATDV